MLRYLNLEMKKNREFDSPRAERFRERFRHAVESVHSTLKRPFRPSGVINSAVLEAVIITMLEEPGLGGQQLDSGYKLLLSNKEFLLLIKGATTDTQVLKSRIEKAKEILLNAKA